MPRLVLPNVSNAPASIRCSTVLLLRTPAILVIKSCMEWKSPLLVLSSIIAVIVGLPILFTALNPNLISLPSTLKSATELLTSTGRILIPISLAARIYSATLLVLSVTLDMSHAIYCTGKCTLRYAVWYATTA